MTKHGNGNGKMTTSMALPAVPTEVHQKIKAIAALSHNTVETTYLAMIKRGVATVEVIL